MTPASIRNNNPGAMEPGPSSKKFGATAYETLRWRGPDGKPKTNRIATFATPQHGAAAQFDLLERRYAGMPLRDAVARWCGSYWSGSYAASVEAACGITADQMLTKEMIRDPARAVPLAKAMARVEAGRDFPMDDDGWQDAHRMAFGAALAPAPSPDNDVPFQKAEARSREVTATVVKHTTVWGSAASFIAWVVDQATGFLSGGIPAPPEKLVSSVSNIGAWKGLGLGIVADPIVLAVGVALAGVWGITWLRRPS